MLTVQLDMLWSPLWSQVRSAVSTGGFHPGVVSMGTLGEAAVTILGMARGSRWKKRNQRQPVFLCCLNNDVGDLCHREEWDSYAGKKWYC